MPSPLNVGPKMGVARGWPNFSNALRGAPDSVNSWYASPFSSCVL